MFRDINCWLWEEKLRTRLVCNYWGKYRLKENILFQVCIASRLFLEKCELSCLASSMCLHSHYLDNFFFSRLHFCDQPGVCWASPLPLIVGLFEYLWEILLHIFFLLLIFLFLSIRNMNLPLSCYRASNRRDWGSLCSSAYLLSQYYKAFIKTDCPWAKVLLFRAETHLN